MRIVGLVWTNRIIVSHAMDPSETRTHQSVIAQLVTSIYLDNLTALSALYFAKHVSSIKHTAPYATLSTKPALRLHANVRLIIFSTIQIWLANSVPTLVLTASLLQVIAQHVTWQTHIVSIMLRTAVAWTAIMMLTRLYASRVRLRARIVSGEQDIAWPVRDYIEMCLITRVSATSATTITSQLMIA